MGALIEKRYVLCLLCIMMIMMSCINEFGQKQGNLSIIALQTERTDFWHDSDSVLNCRLIWDGEKRLHIEYGAAFPCDMTKLKIKCKAKGNTLYVDESYNGGKANGIHYHKIQFDTQPIVQTQWDICIRLIDCGIPTVLYTFPVTLSKDKEIVTYFSDLK